MTEVAPLPQAAPTHVLAQNENGLGMISCSFDTDEPRSMRLCAGSAKFPIEQKVDEVTAEANRWLFGPARKTLEGAKRMKHLLQKQMEELFDPKNEAFFTLMSLQPKIAALYNINKQVERAVSDLSSLREQLNLDESEKKDASKLEICLQTLEDVEYMWRPRNDVVGFVGFGIEDCKKAREFINNFKRISQRDGTYTETLAKRIDLLTLSISSREATLLGEEARSDLIAPQQNEDAVVVESSNASDASEPSKSSTQMVHDDNFACEDDISAEYFFDGEFCRNLRQIYCAVIKRPVRLIQSAFLEKQINKWVESVYGTKGYEKEINVGYNSLFKETGFAGSQQLGSVHQKIGFVFSTWYAKLIDLQNSDIYEQIARRGPKFMKVLCNILDMEEKEPQFSEFYQM